MAIILIDPVKVRTTGGYDAVITGIDPTNHDIIRGTIDTPGIGVVTGSWNASGICRNSGSDCNLNPKDDDVRDVIETARQLGGQA